MAKKRKCKKKLLNSLRNSDVPLVLKEHESWERNRGKRNFISPGEILLEVSREISAIRAAIKLKKYKKLEKQEEELFVKEFESLESAYSELEGKLRNDPDNENLKEESKDLASKFHDLQKKYSLEIERFKDRKEQN